MNSMEHLAYTVLCVFIFIVHRHKGEYKLLSPLVENLKRHANTLFEQNQYKRAIDVYNQAIFRCNTAAVLYGNRAAAYMKRKW